MKLAKRNINIDLIKSIAVYLVISVHFFAHIKLYQIIIGWDNYIAIYFRTLFMVCVPLFIITTGYLMKNKELSKKYYFGILRVIIIYALDGILFNIYRHIYYGEVLTIKHTINVILSFDVGYSWYIEMYLGLFLLIPFLNIIFNNLKNHKEQIILIITMLVLTAFPGLLNIDKELLPAWWTRLYPITYYFIGCYLKDNKIVINKILNIALIICTVTISAHINTDMSEGQHFVCDLFNDWGSILIVIPAVLMFIFFLNINLENINNKIKRIIAKISELSLGIYLTSAIVDDLLYFNYYSVIKLRSVLGYFKIVPLVFILSTSLALIINIIYKLINKYIIDKYIKRFFI